MSLVVEVEAPQTIHQLFVCSCEARSALALHLLTRGECNGRPAQNYTPQSVMDVVRLKSEVDTYILITSGS